MFVEVLSFIAGAVLSPLAVHAGQRYLDRDKSAERVKARFIEILNHRSYTDRSFSALKNAVGGYSDDELRRFILEIGSQKAVKGDKEWWYLIERSEERIARKQQK